MKTIKCIVSCFVIFLLIFLSGCDDCHGCGHTPQKEAIARELFTKHINTL
jgi:hypothetical protein